MEFRFVPISENISIPVPKDWTREQEMQWLAQYKMDHDLAEMETDYLEFSKQIEAGNLVSAEQLLKELEETNQPIEKESA